MGMFAQTAAGEIQFTTLLSRATKFSTRLVPSNNGIVFTRGEVELLIEALETMRDYKSVNPITKTPVIEDTSVSDGMVDWFHRKLKNVDLTINNLKAWLLLDEESLHFV